MRCRKSAGADCVKTCWCKWCGCWSASTKPALYQTDDCCCCCSTVELVEDFLLDDRLHMSTVTDVLQSYSHSLSLILLYYYSLWATLPDSKWMNEWTYKLRNAKMSHRCSKYIQCTLLYVISSATELVYHHRKTFPPIRFADMRRNDFGHYSHYGTNSLSIIRLLEMSRNSK